MIVEGQIYSARGVAKELRIATTTVYAMAKNGRIPCFQATPHSQLRFAGWQIRAWIDSMAKEKEVKQNGSKTERGHRNTVAL
ncbi:helix-turn-helix domain-containing protein [Megasphaera paucivorans]|uniref:Helix-turn-helix domain-containing protein n=1 Tax=Megasphaera paucivorans TaxID=349095 RepID=A0A1G9QEW0_9FIRM|nr:helix-turn-helix domain-containing protein [Megasphaera paucivorans]SDM09568.1 Helix-turn-helix domain-containing protein [Megasphaera paucivorans]